MTYVVARSRFGFKGGWPACETAGVGCEPVFDATAQETVKYLRDTMGVRHSAQWVNEPRSQAAWDAYGALLHG